MTVCRHISIFDYAFISIMENKYIALLTVVSLYMYHQQGKFFSESFSLSVEGFLWKLTILLDFIELFWHFYSSRTPSILYLVDKITCNFAIFSLLYSVHTKKIISFWSIAKTSGLHDKLQINWFHLIHHDF